ncbi:MAG: type II secretion system protein [Candidatus Sumerlaeia bacterium]|nr:type II secretion system protein [Candidatus Sumerlaeia bacterium]
MSRRGYILLEVLVAVVIMAVAFVGILKGFGVALHTMSQIRVNEQAMYLGQTLMDDLELEPPDAGSYEGRFTDDPARFGDEFASFGYRIEVDEEKPRYKEDPKGKPLQDLETFYRVDIAITHTDKRDRERTVLTLNTIVIEATLFSDQSLQSNQVF